MMSRLFVNMSRTWRFHTRLSLLRRLLSSRWPYGGGRLARLLTLLGQLCDRHDLDLQIDRRSRMRLVDELLLAQAERLHALCGNLERVDQHIADRIRATLAQDHIGLAFPGRIAVADDQEGVGRQPRIDQRIGEAAKRLVRIGPYHR